MARIGINTGATANDGTGDNLRAGAGIVNDNFLEIYNYLGAGSTTELATPLWRSVSAGINTLSKVGVGTTAPTSQLTVSGDAIISGVTTLNSSSGVGTVTVGYGNTALFVDGEARIIGILTVGRGSITFDGNNNNITVGSGITITGSTGIIEAMSLVVDGTTLTGASVTSITAGSGISVDQSTGNVTITATGGGSIAGIDTTGTSTFTNINATGIITAGSAVQVGAGISVAGSLNVSGISTFKNSLVIDKNYVLYFGLSDSTPNGLYVRHTDSLGAEIVNVSNQGGDDRKITIQSSRDGDIVLKGQYSNRAVFSGYGATVTGTTFTNQLNVSGISTLGNTIVGGATTEMVVGGNLRVNGTVHVSGIVTSANAGVATYFGDTSKSAHGKYLLINDGFTNYNITGTGITAGTTSDPKLYLARGHMYEFINNSSSSHPLVIRFSDGGANYTAGATNNDGSAHSGTVLRFEVPLNAPNTLYYQCSNHTGMGNTIVVYPDLHT